MAFPAPQTKMGKSGETRNIMIHKQDESCFPESPGSHNAKYTNHDPKAITHLCMQNKPGHREPGKKSIRTHRSNIEHLWTLS